MAKCCFALGALHAHTRTHAHFWKCKQSNRKSNKHFNPSHFVCIFVYVFIFIFVMCYLFRWFCMVAPRLNRWQCCTFGQLSKIQANDCLLRLNFPGIEVLRSHLHTFGLVWNLCCFWHGTRHAAQIHAKEKHPRTNDGFRLTVQSDAKRWKDI